MKQSPPLLLLCLVSILNSCMDADPVLERSLKIEDVKSYYFQSKGNTSTREDSSFPEFDILWEDGCYEEISLGDALVFPIDFAEPVYISNEIGHVISAGERSVYGFAYMVDEEIHFERVNAFKTNISDAFTGYLIVEDWSGTPLRYLNYENGNFVGEYPIIENPEGQRTDEFVFSCTTTIYYTCWGDIPHDCRPDSRSAEVCTIKEVIQIAGPGASGEDYPGGGPGTPSVVYSCNEGEGFFSDGADGCVRRCGEGEVLDENENCVPDVCPASPCCGLETEEFIRCLDDIPCSGDPLVNMEITSPGASGINGGRFGCTRIGNGCGGFSTKKFHDGIDLTAPAGSYVFAASQGEIIQIRDSFNPMAYGRNSYGNYVIVESTNSDGMKFRMKYNHLDFIDVRVGQEVNSGMLLGRTGTTGNASGYGVTPHLHLQAMVKIGSSWEKSNPENFLSTAYNEEGLIIFDPCLN